MNNDGPYRFRKKPVEIAAMAWDGDNTAAIAAFAGDAVVGVVTEPLASGTTIKLEMTTLEGPHYASVGDWIIRGVAGEFYPCKPDIFVKTYEPSGGVVSEGDPDAS
jgi:hypothetical protein